MALLQKIDLCDSVAKLEISPDIPTRLYKLQIENETLKLMETVLRADNFEKDYQWIHHDASKSPNLPACYLIKDDRAFNTFVLITYVPDSALTFIKLQYACCLNTLKRSIPQLQIVSNIFASTLEELEYSVYLDYLKHKAKNVFKDKNEDRLDVENDDQNFSQSIKLPGMQPRTADFFVSDEIRLKMNELRSGSISFLAIGIEGEKFYHINSWESAPKKDEFPNHQPFYVVCKTQHTKEKIFVYVCPETVKIKEKMISASAKASLLLMIREVLGTKLRTEQAENAEEALEYIIKDSISISKPLKEIAFKRPKPPGRPRAAFPEAISD